MNASPKNNKGAEHKFTNYELLSRLMNCKHKSRLITEPKMLQIQTETPKSSRKNNFHLPNSVIEIYELSDPGKKKLKNQKGEEKLRYSSRLSSYMRIKT